MTPHLLTMEIFFGALGIVLGLVHFRGLRLATNAYLEGGPHARAIALHAARLVVTAGAFVLIARAGALALLATFAGFLVARFIATARGGSPR